MNNQPTTTTTDIPLSLTTLSGQKSVNDTLDHKRASLGRGDRFVPKRNPLLLETYKCKMTSPTTTDVANGTSTHKFLRELLHGGPVSATYASLLEEFLFGRQLKTANLYVNSQEQQQQQLSLIDKTRIRKTKSPYSYFPSTRPTQSNVKTTPCRVLDAPNVLDDYYLNVLDWSMNGMVVVGFSDDVYTWRSDTGVVNRVYHCTEPNNYISSVACDDLSGDVIAIGTKFGYVAIYDVEKQKMMRKLRWDRGERVSCLAWNKHLLCSAGKDKAITVSDVRIKNSMINKFFGHSQEICGLKWDQSGTKLASGGNDDMVNVWHMHHNKPIFLTEKHKAAVKALAWCPWISGVLATGGGTNDRHIHVWDVSTGECLRSVDAQSQVSAIHFSESSLEMVSSHGYSSFNIALWDCVTMKKKKELSHHQGRILAVAKSPDNKTICSLSADESLAFWDVFPQKKGVFSTRGLARTIDDAFDERNLLVLR